MKKYTPYIGAGLIVAMLYFLYQLNSFSKNLTELATVLHATPVLTLFSICSLCAILLGVIGLRQKNPQLNYVSWSTCIGGVLILLFTWIAPFFV